MTRKTRKQVPSDVLKRSKFDPTALLHHLEEASVHLTAAHIELMKERHRPGVKLRMMTEWTRDIHALYNITARKYGRLTMPLDSGN